LIFPFPRSVTAPGGTLPGGPSEVA